jgi:hypothetical protein
MNSEDANPHLNPEIGRSLKWARTERGLRLWQVEEATKIRARYLQDLERENFDVLPAVYVLGFLKTYADYLGLNGEALSRQLKDRQASLQQEQDPTDEELMNVEHGGFLAALARLTDVLVPDARADDEDVAAPATVSGRGPRLYLSLGAVMILVLAVTLTTILGGGDQPAVSQVREPAIPEAPSRIAFSNHVQDGREGGRDDGRSQDYNGKYARPEEQTLSSDEEDEKGEKGVKDQVKRSDQDEDDVRPEATGDVAINLPAPSTASAGASLTAAASAATSTPAAASPADASSAATDPAFSAPTAVPSATTPESANPGAAPRPAAEPAAVRPAPVAGSPDGAGQSGAGGLDATRLAGGIFSRMRSATAFAR